MKIKRGHTFNKRFLVLCLFSVFASTLTLFLSCLSTNDVFATGATSTSSVTIGTAENVSVSLTPSPTGSSATSDTSSFTVTTDNYTGYTLKIFASDDTGRLNKSTACESADSSRCYISSMESAATSITTNNTWGYKPSYYNSTANSTNFYPAPTTTGDTLRVTSAANATGTSDTYTLAIGAKVDFQVEPGTYTKTFTIMAVGNPITYDIEYTDNTGTGGTVGSDVSGLPSSHQTGSIANGIAAVTLNPYPAAPATEPTRTGYVFSGWCSVATTSNGTVCSGTTYTYNSTNQNYGTMDINETANNTSLKLYALWVPYMWNASYSDCGSTLWDNRDGTERSYTTAEINNLCWMTTNLDLAGGTTLTPTLSNVSSNYTLPASSTSDFAYDDTAYVYNSGNTNCSSTSPSVPCYSYYSYVAATAGTNPSSGDATSDICPKGWRLPTYSEFYYTTATALTDGPWQGVYTGYYYGSYYTDPGGDSWYSGGYEDGSGFNELYGCYWSSTATNIDGAGYWYLHKGGPWGDDAGSPNNSPKRRGMAVRCVKGYPYVQTTEVRYENADGTWGNYTEVDSQIINAGQTYSWSTSQLTGFDSTTYQSTTVPLYAVTETHTNYVSIYRNTVTISKQYRLENADGTWGEYIDDGTETIYYSGSYTYSKIVENYKGSSSGENDSAASATANNIISSQSIQLSLYRNTYTCSKQYRLENADGTWGDYVADGSETVRYGGSCSYSNSINDYKGSSGSSNGSAGSTSASDIAVDTILSLSMYRNTYTLTVSAGSNTSSASGGGSKRWGQASTVSVTKASNVTCTTYATPTWTQSGTAGTFSSTSGASVTFTMGKGNATVTATSSASNVAQTVTLSRGTGVSSIKIAGTNYSSSSVSLNCGSYSISGNYSTNYTFSSWSRANGVTVASTSSSSTTMTVSGAGTLTLNGKYAIGSCTDANCLQNTSATCGNTMKDARDGNSYTTATINSKCWMTQNLRVTGTISSTYSNFSRVSSFNVCAGDLTSGNSYDQARCHNSGNTTNGVWYNYAAASAGSITGANNTSNATQDICPSGWRLPTYSEYSAITSSGLNYFKVTGGSYGNGSNIPDYPEGYWWSATAWSGSYRYNLFYNSRSNYLHTSYNISYAGFYVRCVRN